MNTTSSRSLRLAAVLVAAALPLVGACGKKTKPAATTVASQPAPSRPAPAKAQQQAPTSTVTAQPAGDEQVPAFSPIRFEFDSTTLSQEARQELSEVAAWMTRSKGTLTIEGHADERGTDEYNLALGQQRAETIASYLERLGIARARLQTITYGEERPAVSGSDESAWAANRRGELQPR